MRKVSKGANERLANSVVRLTLEGDTEEAKKLAGILATFTNVQRLPGGDGQPGFGRGWGFGDPYNEVGYGRSKSQRNIPNTGDLPTTFQEQINEDDEEDEDDIAEDEKTAAETEDSKKKKKKKKKDEKPKPVEEDAHEDVPEHDTLDPDDLGMVVHAEVEEEDDIIYDPDDAIFDPEDFDMDIVFASALEKVSSVLGKKASRDFAGIFGVLNHQKTAETDDNDEDLVEVEVEAIPEKKPRNKREVMQVWREDLIPDVTPIIRRVLKHVSVQYSLPFSTLTNALRGQDSQVAGMLADALDGVSRGEE